MSESDIMYDKFHVLEVKIHINFIEEPYFISSYFMFRLMAYLSDAIFLCAKNSNDKLVLLQFNYYSFNIIFAKEINCCLQRKNDKVYRLVLLY